MKNPNLKIVSITGKKGHGKDYVGAVIVRLTHGYFKKAQRFAFGDALKEVCSIIFGVPLHIYHADDSIKSTTPTCWRWCELEPALLKSFPQHGEFVTVRESLQLMGTEIFRNTFCRDTWVRLVEHKLSACDADYAVITDMRFLSEAARMREMGAKLIRVIDPNKPLNTGSHQSEAEMERIEVDHTIINDHARTPDDLYKEVSGLIWLE